MVLEISARVARPEELRTGSTRRTSLSEEPSEGAAVGTRADQDGCSSPSASCGWASTRGEEATEVPESVTPPSPDCSWTKETHSEESGIHTWESVSPMVGPPPVMP